MTDSIPSDDAGGDGAIGPFCDMLVAEFRRQVAAGLISSEVADDTAA
jgi:hypothetical protein